MNRIQFWILIAGSCLVALLLLLQAVEGRQAQVAEARMAATQQVISDGASCQVRLRQLVGRVYQLSQQDQGLKDVLTRAHITVRVAPSSGSTSSTPSDSSTSSQTH